MTRPAAAELGWVREALPELPPRLARLVDQAAAAVDFPASDVYSLADFLAVVPRAAETLGLLVVPLFLALEEGSLAIDLAPAALERRLRELVPEEDFRAWIDAALTDLDRGAF